MTSVNSESEVLQETAFKNSENKVEKTGVKQQIKKAEVLEQKKDNQTEFEVKGKAETGQPIEIYNVQNGDTLQSIKVSGNADVHIRTKASQSEHVNKENASESLIEKFKEFSENIVEENNIKERFKEAKQKTKDVRVKGFQSGLWIVLAVLGAVGISIFGIYKYLKRKK